MDIQEFARLGGLARAKSLSPERRVEIAKLGASIRYKLVPKMAPPSEAPMTVNPSSETTTGVTEAPMLVNHTPNKFNKNWCDTHNLSLEVCKKRANNQQL